MKLKFEIPSRAACSWKDKAHFLRMMMPEDWPETLKILKALMIVFNSGLNFFIKPIRAKNANENNKKIFLPQKNIISEWLKAIDHISKKKYDEVCNSVGSIISHDPQTNCKLHQIIFPTCPFISLPLWKLVSAVSLCTKPTITNKQTNKHNLFTF